MDEITIAEFEDVKKELEKERTRVEQYRGWWLESDRKVSALELEINELKESVSDKEVELEALNAEYNELREINANLTGEIRGLKFATRCREQFVDEMPHDERGVTLW